MSGKKYTYMWQLQPYKTDKGISRIEVAPSNSRPLTNGGWDNNQFNDAKDGNAFLPRPIKHWRKQLQPDSIRSGSKSKTIIEAFQPGGTIFLNGKVNEENECCQSGNATTKLSSYIPIEKFNKSCKTEKCSYTVTAQNVADGWNGPIGKKICCNPVYNRIKSSTTILSKKYYTDSRAYLRSRNKLYNQKNTTLPYPGVTYYGSNGNLLYPNDNPLGPQVFSTGECPQTACGGKQQITIFKPNNRQFSKQGAVESSTRIDKLKLDTVNKSGNSLVRAYGKSAAKAGSYYLNGTTPYLIKDKIGKCEIKCKKTVPPPPITIDYLSVDLTTLRGPPIYGSNIGYGSGSWFGGVLAPNGKLYFAPRNEKYVLVVNTNNNTLDPVINTPSIVNTAYESAVVGIDGKVYMIPANSTSVLIIDPNTNIPDLTTITGLVGTSKWAGGALAPNGKIYCTPRNSNRVLIIDPLSPITNITNVTPSTSSYTNSTAILNCPGATFLSSVNIGDNILITTSSTSYTGYIESITSNTQIKFIYRLGTDILSGTIINIQKTRKADITTISGLPTTSTKWIQSVLAQNGKIYCIPRNETYVLIIDPMTNAIDTTSITGLSASTDKWAGGVLAPNGKIYCAPYNETNVLIIDPITNTTDTTTISGLSSNTLKWYSGVLGANGKIYFMPYSSKNILIVDPTNNTYDTTTLSFSGISNLNFSYGALAPNNSIYGFTYGYNDNANISSVLILPPTYS